METTELANSNPGFSGEISNEGTYSVKIDGVEQLVPLEELQNGYQRQADYTRKTQELARETDGENRGKFLRIREYNCLNPADRYWWPGLTTVVTSQNRKLRSAGYCEVSLGLTIERRAAYSS